MYIFVGLGNPGEKYEGTRHNVGFVVLDALFLSQKSNLSPSPRLRGAGKSQNHNVTFKNMPKLGAEVLRLGGVMLVKPQTFMNKSGEAVKKVVDYFSDKLQIPNTKYQNIYVIHDDLDISLGEYKIQFGKGPKQHGGVNSVEYHLGTEGFWRVRVGVENRLQQVTGSKLEVPNNIQTSKSQLSKHIISGERYVLGRFSKEEREVVDEVVNEVVKDIMRRVDI